MWWPSPLHLGTPSPGFPYSEEERGSGANVMVSAPPIPGRGADQKLQDPVLLKILQDPMILCSTGPKSYKVGHSEQSGGLPIST